MRNVVTAIQNRDGQSLQQMYAAEKPKQQVPEQAAQIFNELFRQLKAAFPALMTSIKDQSDLNELRRQWVLAFIENGITSIDQVNAGMKIARQQATPFLPSPGQFIAWCKQGATRAAGLPDADELYDMVMDYAKRRDMFSSAEAFPWPSNPAYWMVTKLYSQQRVQGLSEQDLRKRCGKELADMSKRIEAGEPIPAPVVQIPKLHIPVSNEKALDHIAELRAKLNMTRKS
ncbi:TPA: DNA replication protein [Yersinia enterocolitica]|uniref:replication protein P n=1 Tax=Yersinia bercovieri TaxID=634 RepID=UPI0011A5CEE0|nr:replication protein P [Yersinia bercovieri]EKN3779513.1 DNA replication protein [Yersinia enterocolitica]EKN6170693.1 DNA replication protein [Yersinia enterocolitica]EKN6399392.1 DNA replication protein [Yersinia enterocolitica]EKN6412540.1 DNA replication protein [Yersinia enterocolitica]ELI8371619.1 DNA replication protein [Yersinia enterocolitica]